MMDKCAYCLKIRLRAVERLRTMKALADEYNRDTRVDDVSVFPASDVLPELDPAADEQVAA